MISFCLCSTSNSSHVHSPSQIHDLFLFNHYCYSSYICQNFTYIYGFHIVAYILQRLFSRFPNRLSKSQVVNHKPMYVQVTVNIPFMIMVLIISNHSSCIYYCPIMCQGQIFISLDLISLKEMKVNLNTVGSHY